jgi:hypothetical protein
MVRGVDFCPEIVHTTFVAEKFNLATSKTIRIQVETNDGCRTIWYEKSTLKNPTDFICKRVQYQLAGLNLKRVEVSLSPATV